MNLDLSNYRQSAIGYLMWIAIIVISWSTFIIALFVDDWGRAITEAFIATCSMWCCALERHITRQNAARNN